jgi:hypothetical protein
LKVNEFRSLGNRHLYSEDRGRLCRSEDSQFNPIQFHSLESRDSETRSISKAEIVRFLNCNENLDEGQKSNLIHLLIEYAPYLTYGPGKCTIFEYAFMTDEKPIMSHTRLVPFSLRPAVREQTDHMLSDDILERSKSPFINALTVVPRREGPPRICIDARKVNSVTIQDRERTPPLHGLLQKFNGVKYMSSIDSSSAFLQIPLRDSSRQYTAFIFDPTVYQYNRTPYVFRNSLSAFVRALRMVLGDDTSEFVVAYVDDVLVFSRPYSENLSHLNTVLTKLTRAGLTVNAFKCCSCQAEVKFLGHKIPRPVSGPQRIAAIFKYPAPRNKKQLRLFLGTCNFHSRFIMIYANYVGPLLPLMKRGTRWTWTDEMQSDFETLRAQFARSIELIHPDVDLPYLIYTDACRYGIVVY